MTFSLDLAKPLNRLGLLLNLGFLIFFFSGLSWFSFAYMTEVLPASGAHEQEVIVAQKAQDQAFAKAKAAAKGKAFDEKVAIAEAKAKGIEAAEKESAKIHHHAVEGWAPFAIFLLILSAIFFAGFLSIALLRRANDAGVSVGLSFLSLLAGWAFAAFVAFEPFLDEQHLTKVWAPAPIIGLILLLPLFLKGSTGAHDSHAH